MKKTILLMLPFALGLAACSGGSPLNKGNIITPKFMERNFVNTNSFEFVKNDYEIDKVVEIGAYSLSGYVSANHKDWLVMTDSEGKEAVYSQLGNKFVTPFVESFDFLYVDYVDVNLTDDIAFLEYAIYDDESEETWTWHVVDELGNEPFAAVSTESGSYIEVAGRTLDVFERSGQEFFVSFLQGYNEYLFEPQFAVYNIDGSIARKGAYSEYTEQVGSAASLGYNETFADFGHPELAFVHSNNGTSVRYSIYNTKESKFVASFEVPFGASMLVAGDFFIFQELNLLEERATEYDFYQAETAEKYNVTTVKINYTNGSKETLDTKILLGGYAQPLFDEKGVNKYAYAENARVIRDDKTLENTLFGFILDENMNIAADVTGIDFLDLERIDNDHYFDDSSYIMYNGKLEEVAFMPNYEEIESNGVVFSTREGFYGLYSFDGKVVLQAKFNFLFEIENGIYYCGDDKGEYFYKVENDAATLVKGYDFETYTYAGYYDPFYTCVAYAYETEEGPEYKFFNMVTCQEFEQYEPAEGDTILGNVGYAYALGQTMVSYSYLGEHADGSIFLVQYTLKATWAYPEIAE